ncbi:hypothetical protein PRO82_001223 [Candidatus Protochlamydia amoebophila]|nr:hypothetical protein [Candidatus Protochlamydia amoebophila]
MLLFFKRPLHYYCCFTTQIKGSQYKKINYSSFVLIFCVYHVK